MNTQQLTQLATEIFVANDKQGFWQKPEQTPEGGTCLVANPDYLLLKKAEKIALMHSELSECLEGIRKPGRSDKIPEFSCEEEELADALIRILDYAAGFHIRLAQAVEAKLAYNATRPFRHGKKF